MSVAVRPPDTERPSTAAPVASSAPAGAPPILVASDGRDADESAMLAASRLAERLGGAPQVLAVLAPFPVFPAYGDLPVAPLDALEEERAAVSRQAVRRRMAAVVDAAWPTQVVFGEPSDTIARVAEERRAALVILGIGRHRLVDRLFGSETVLRLVRSSDRPLLAVGPEADGVIRRAVVGVDFSLASTRAAAIAAQLVAPGGTLSLVHVKARADLSPPTWKADGDVAADRTSELLRRLAVELRHGTTADDGNACGRRDVTIGMATLVGDPAAELLDYAERVGADLVAVGTRGPGLVERLLVGSVATDVVRDTSARLPAASVLCCPESDDDADVLHRLPRSSGRGAPIRSDRGAPR